jgi:hypothetical protein
MRRSSLLLASVILACALAVPAAGQTPAPTTTTPAPKAKKKAKKPATAPAAPLETAAAPAPVVADSTSRVQPDTTPATAAATAQPEPPAKKGGFFGKAKGLAHNKVVRQVAKVAACTMVPGGQIIAGAIDAGSNTSVGGVAAGAAGAATGTSCMGAMGQMGMTNAAMQAAQPNPAMMGGGGSQAAMMQQAAAMQAMGMHPTGPIGIVPNLSIQLANGKTTLTNLPWMPGTATLFPESASDYEQAMTRLAEAMKETPGTYKITVWAKDAGTKDANKQIAATRGQTIQAALIHDGVEESHFAPQVEGKQGDPKMEISRSK